LALKVENSLIGAITVGALVIGIYDYALPKLADARVSPAGDEDLAAAEKTAAWSSAAVVAGVSLVAKDPTIFVTGGLLIVGLSWMHRHANWVNPLTGKASTVAGVSDGGGNPPPVDEGMADQAMAY
jgi:hypothetical protein